MSRKGREEDKTQFSPSVSIRPCFRFALLTQPCLAQPYITRSSPKSSVFLTCNPDPKNYGLSSTQNPYRFLNFPDFVYPNPHISHRPLSDLSSIPNLALLKSTRPTLLSKPSESRDSLTTDLRPALVPFQPLSSSAKKSQRSTPRPALAPVDHPRSPIRR